MINISSLTWTIALTVVAGFAAAPPVALRVHAWMVRVFRLHESQANFVREFVQWSYVILVLCFGILACYAGDQERQSSDSDTAELRSQVTDLHSQINGIYEVVSHDHSVR